MTSFTPDQWIILGLTFVLGLLVGMWLTSGGRRKWKARYNEEVENRRRLEGDLKDRETHWATREKDWREQESLRESALRDRQRGPVVVQDERTYVASSRTGDVDGDGIPNRSDHRPIGDRPY